MKKTMSKAQPSVIGLNTSGCWRVVYLLFVHFITHLYQ